MSTADKLSASHGLVTAAPPAVEVEADAAKGGAKGGDEGGDEGAKGAKRAKGGRALGKRRALKRTTALGLNARSTGEPKPLKPKSSAKPSRYNFGCVAKICDIARLHIKQAHYDAVVNEVAAIAAAKNVVKVKVDKIMQVFEMHIVGLPTLVVAVRKSVENAIRYDAKRAALYRNNAKERDGLMEGLGRMRLA